MLVAACADPARVTLYEERHGRGAGRGYAALPKGGVHVVRANQSLYQVAQRYGLPLRALIETNALRPPYRLRVGQKLRLPRPNFHKVVRGDTVSGIARRHGVAMSQVVRLNKLAPPYRIYVDQSLRLPAAMIRARVAVRPTRSTSRGKPSQGSAITSRRVAPRRDAPPPAPPGGRASGFQWPVSGPVISGFGPKGKGLHNDGINLAAPRGTPVRAAGAGVVAYAGNALRGYGKLVLLKHPKGFMTAYAHNDSILVKEGQRVRRGETIARVGSSGSVSNPQLHFEIRKGRAALDPIRYLGRRTAFAD